MESASDPATSQVAGAPATQVFFLHVTEPGTCYIQIEQFSPTSKQPVSTYSVTYTAY